MKVNNTLYVSTQILFAQMQEQFVKWKTVLLENFPKVRAKRSLMGFFSTKFSGWPATLTHFTSIFHFYSPWKHQKASGFQGYCNGTMVLNRLIWNNSYQYFSRKFQNFTEKLLQPPHFFNALFHRVSFDFKKLKFKFNPLNASVALI